MRLIACFFAIGLTAIVSAQPQNTDSVWSIWEDESKHDTVRLEALRMAIWERYFFTQPDSAFHFAKVLQDRAEAIDEKQMMAEAINIQAGTFYIKGEIDQAIPYAEQYVALYEKYWPASRNYAAALLNMATLYSSTGDKVKAIQSFEKGEEIASVHDYKDVQGGALMGLGNEYESLGEYSLALNYLEDALTLMRDVGDQGKIGNALANIAVAYNSQGEYETALDYILQAYEIHQDLEDAYYISGTLLLIGQIYLELEDFDNALSYSIKAVELSANNDLKKNLAGARVNLGDVYFRINELANAEENCLAALNLATEQSLFEEELSSCECLYRVAKLQGNATEALLYYERKVALEDSLKVTETAKELQRVEFDKKLLADSLKQEALKHEMELTHQEEVATKDRMQNLLMSGGLLLLLVAGGLFSRNRHVNRSKNAIQKEKDRSDELLLNILPEEVAEELKEKGAAEAQLIDQVTVLFTDFKGFTAMSEKLSPKDLVDDLNLCFSEFDRITAKYGIEKIKTIGDAYMAAGGLPTPNTTHATDIINAAIEMRDFVEAGRAKKREAALPYFEIRIGVHTGPVVAGIVGVKKFQYDIWGDTVNTASRMESSGEVGKVNISQATYELLKDDSPFTFESRGKIAAKGKGEIEMYFVSKK